jgi:hypothetical protein
MIEEPGRMFAALLKHVLPLAKGPLPKSRK